MASDITQQMITQTQTNQQQAKAQDLQQQEALRQPQQLQTPIAQSSLNPITKEPVTPIILNSPLPMQSTPGNQTLARVNDLTQQQALNQPTQPQPIPQAQPSPSIDQLAASNTLTLQNKELVTNDLLDYGRKTPSQIKSEVEAFNKDFQGYKKEAGFKEDLLTATKRYEEKVLAQKTKVETLTKQFELNYGKYKEGSTYTLPSDELLKQAEKDLGSLSKESDLLNTQIQVLKEVQTPLVNDIRQSLRKFNITPERQDYVKNISENFNKGVQNQFADFVNNPKNLASLPTTSTESFTKSNLNIPTTPGGVRSINEEVIQSLGFTPEKQLQQGIEQVYKPIAEASLVAGGLGVGSIALSSSIPLAITGIGALGAKSLTEPIIEGTKAFAEISAKELPLVKDFLVSKSIEYGSKFFESPIGKVALFPVELAGAAASNPIVGLGIIEASAIPIGKTSLGQAIEERIIGTVGYGLFELGGTALAIKGTNALANLELKNTLKTGAKEVQTLFEEVPKPEVSSKVEKMYEISVPKQTYYSQTITPTYETELGGKINKLTFFEEPINEATTTVQIQRNELGLVPESIFNKLISLQKEEEILKPSSTLIKPNEITFEFKAPELSDYTPKINVNRANEIKVVNPLDYNIPRSIENFNPESTLVGDSNIIIPNSVRKELEQQLNLGLGSNSGTSNLVPQSNLGSIKVLNQEFQPSEIVNPNQLISAGEFPSKRSLLTVTNPENVQQDIFIDVNRLYESAGKRSALLPEEFIGAIGSEASNIELGISYKEPKQFLNYLDELEQSRLASFKSSGLNIKLEVEGEKTFVNIPFRTIEQAKGSQILETPKDLIKEFQSYNEQQNIIKSTAIDLGELGIAAKEGLLNELKPIQIFKPSKFTEEFLPIGKASKEGLLTITVPKELEEITTKLPSGFQGVEVTRGKQLQINLEDLGQPYEYVRTPKTPSTVLKQFELTGIEKQTIQESYQSQNAKLATSIKADTQFKELTKQFEQPQEPKFDVKLKTDLATKVKTGIDQLVDTGTKQLQSLRTDTLQKQKTFEQPKQLERLKEDLDRSSRYLLPGGSGAGGSGSPASILKNFAKPQVKTKTPGFVLPDLFSRTAAQLKYGKATNPSQVQAQKQYAKNPILGLVRPLEFFKKKR